jgi:hypothetical protein
MELIDRYLQAVKFWLPKNQKQDIIAELSEDLREQVEEREERLGRKLNESEVAELLKQRGRPVLVANQFRPQQQLIGPVLFPIYLFVLEVVGAFYLAPWILVWIAIAVFRPAHPGQNLLTTIGLLWTSFWGSFWPMAFFMIGSITVIFAILERVQNKSKFMEQWDPRKLPPVRDPNRIAISASVTELIANMVFCTWWAFWVGELWYPALIHFAGVTIQLAPTWRYFFWGFLLLGVGNTVLAAVNLFRPYWTSERASLRLVSDVIGAALFCWLVKANIVAGLSVVNVAPERTAQIAHAINWWSARMFPAAVAFCGLIALNNVYRIIRVRSKTGPGAVLSLTR